MISPFGNTAHRRPYQKPGGKHDKGETEDLYQGRPYCKCTHGKLQNLRDGRSCQTRYIHHHQMEKVNIMEALAMAGDMTVYGQRDKVKLIREDAQGNRQVIPLNLNDADIIVSPYYYLQQNDVVYVTPNKTKAKNAGISNSTTIWFSVVGTLVSLVSLIVTIAK